eukprot:TRINITY_DN244_c1_g1_i4.p1 TRINITY_DN244_c1_g1~~TRINITY_DN244_c1_g1_i4.p1  ORF type:complete len:741 (-),score=60.20 TRINITY_DN244_c1_g1_i4:17-2185(-)
MAETWSVDEVAKWLQSVGFADLAPRFLEEAISGDVLLALTSDELRKELDVPKFGIRKRLLGQIEKLRNAVPAKEEPGSEPKRSAHGSAAETVAVVPIHISVAPAAAAAAAEPPESHDTHAAGRSSGASETPAQHDTPSLKPSVREHSRSPSPLGKKRNCDAPTLAAATDSLKHGTAATPTPSDVPRSPESARRERSRSARRPDLSAVDRNGSQEEGHARVADEQRFRLHDIVRFVRLSAKALNGLQGKVCGRDASRLLVRMDDASVKSVKPENLLLIQRWAKNSAADDVGLRSLDEIMTQRSSGRASSSSKETMRNHPYFHARREERAQQASEAAFAAGRTEVSPADKSGSHCGGSEAPSAGSVHPAADSVNNGCDGDAQSDATQYDEDIPHGSDIHPDDELPNLRPSLRAAIATPEELRVHFGEKDVNKIEVLDPEEVVKARIRKIMNTAFNPGSTDAESRQALRQAQKLMHKHCLNDEDIFTKADQPETLSGMGAASITMTTPHSNHSNDSFSQISQILWLRRLTKALAKRFDVGCYWQGCWVVFYGNRVGAESAAYGFVCAANRIDWMAGSRPLPEDGRVTWNQGPSVAEFGRHRGKRFSDVLAEDPDYVTWAMSHEARLKRVDRIAMSDSVEHFVEYALSKTSPEKFDLAYKEGLAATLLTQAKADMRRKEQAPSLELALNGQREEFLERRMSPRPRFVTQSERSVVQRVTTVYRNVE